MPFNDFWRRDFISGMCGPRVARAGRQRADDAGCRGGLSWPEKTSRFRLPAGHS